MQVCVSQRAGKLISQTHSLLHFYTAYIFFYFFFNFYLIKDDFLRARAPFFSPAHHEICAHSAAQLEKL